MQSDAEEEDEDDPDVILEADLDKNEIIRSRDAECVGDEFLQAYYSTDVPSSQRKKRVCLPAVCVLLMIASYMYCVLLTFYVTSAKGVAFAAAY